MGQAEKKLKKKAPFSGRRIGDANLAPPIVKRLALRSRNRKQSMERAVRWSRPLIILTFPCHGVNMYLHTI